MVKTKRKNVLIGLSIISLIIISIFFLLTLLSTTAFGFIAFTNNIGYQSEKTTDMPFPFRHSIPFLKSSDSFVII